MRRALALTLLLAGCGGGDDDATGGPDGAPGADAPAGADAGAPDAAPGPTDLEKLAALVAALPGAPDDAARDALVAAFVREVAYGAGGFPIREGGRLGVIRWGGDPTASWALAGDFNGWDATALPLAQPVAGYPFWWRVEPIAEPLPRTLYKLVRDGGAEWRADPHARRFGYDSFGEYGLVEAGGASRLERWPAFADGAGALAARDLLVYVPAGYDASDARLPVLYLHDGQNLFDPSAIGGGWRAAEAADQAIASGMARPLLLVGVPNTPARMDEYTHVPDDIGELVGGRASEYVAFLAEGVKPFVDARYRTLAAPATTGVMGSSLGGLVSLYALWARPDVFGHAASLSGTLGWGRIGLANATVMELYAAGAPPAGARIYLDSGGDDGGGCVDADGDGVSDDTPGSSDNYCETLDMAATLRALGWQDEGDLFVRWAPGAPHNEAAWAARLPGALADWFPGP